MLGLTLSGSYSFGGVAGSTNAGSTWATGIQYAAGPLGVGIAFERVNNSNTAGGTWGANSTTSNGGSQVGVSALTNGYQTAKAQQRFAVGLGYRFSDAWDATATYTNTEYIPGAASKFVNTAIFNTVGSGAALEAVGSAGFRRRICVHARDRRERRAQLSLLQRIGDLPFGEHALLHGITSWS